MTRARDGIGGSPEHDLRREGTVDPPEHNLQRRGETTSRRQARLEEPDRVRHPTGRELRRQEARDADRVRGTDRDR